MEGDNTLNRRVMVVADPTRESAGALQYALYHAMIEKDELILVHVMNNPAARKGTLSSFFKRQPEVSDALNGGGGGGGGDGGYRAYSDSNIVRDADFLEVMKRACEAAHPKMKVRIDKVEQGCRDKGAAILCRTKLLSVDLLIIGQRRNLSSVLLGSKRTGSPLLGGSKTVDVAEFLIENCTCTCVGVQKKGQNAGYLLNTKTHRNFWLLA